MNIFLTRKHKYVAFDSIEDIRATIKSLNSVPWYNLSVNLTSKLNQDDSFKISYKSYISLTWGSPAYIVGTLSKENEKTLINATIRPNLGLLLFFYMLILLFLTLLFEFIPLQEEKGPTLLSCILASAFVLGLIHFYSLVLRKKFERLLNLHRHE